MSIPEDQYSSGNRDDKCWAKVYGKTKEEAEAKMKDYFARYPIMGYSTSIASQGWHEDGYYYYYIKRWHSCD
jgi:hypothetical protein